MIDKTEVGKKIFTVRKKMGITQEKLSNLVNVTPQAISKWEKGITLPDTFLLPKLSELFNVSIEEILCINTKNNPSIQGQNSSVMLPGIKYHPCTPPLVGCIKSSLDYLGIHVSTGWISAPYAFMMNINSKVSFMGAEFWDDKGCFDELIRNCGGIHEYFSGYICESNIEQKRKEAWDIIRDSISKGFPCYAWEMDKPLYYLIAGYDKVGYYYIDQESMKIAGPKPFDELGKSEWGVLEVHIIRPGNISDNLKTLKDIFEYAVSVNNPDIYPPNPGYTMGTCAYQVWWEALSNEIFDYYGVAYNASFWAKCKKLASLFLQEAKLRVGIMNDIFDRAISNYENTAASLMQLSNMFPLSKIPDSNITEEQKEKAVKLLKAAQKSEMNGLLEINNLLMEIYKIW